MSKDRSCTEHAIPDVLALELSEAEAAFVDALRVGFDLSTEANGLCAGRGIILLAALLGIHVAFFKQEFRDDAVEAARRRIELSLAEANALIEQGRALHDKEGSTLQ